MQSRYLALSPEDLNTLRELDESARQRGRNVDHAEVYATLKRLADSRPVDLRGRAS